VFVCEGLPAGERFWARARRQGSANERGQKKTAVEAGLRILSVRLCVCLVCALEVGFKSVNKRV